METEVLLLWRKETTAIPGLGESTSHQIYLIYILLLSFHLKLSHSFLIFLIRATYRLILPIDLIMIWDLSNGPTVALRNMKLLYLKNVRSTLK